MRHTDKYNYKIEDHKIWLFQESKKIGTFSREELRELSGAMVVHGVELCGLLRAMRGYVQNPFGNYFYLREAENGIGKKFGGNN